jgi:hypothetical protein
MTSNQACQISQLQSVKLTTTNLFICLKKKYLTGGIICFSVDPKTQNIYILLGRETCFANMNSTNGKWCDFGGKLKKNETPEEGSAREFAEECLCSVHMSKIAKTTYKTYITSVVRMLIQKQYFLKISIVVSQTPTSEKIRVYYLKEIQWQPGVSDRFKVLRRSLTSDMTNFPFSMRNHPAVTLQPDNTLKINRDFLEKQHILWWSLDRLGEVLKNKGRFKHHRFRYSFLPVLSVVVNKLRSSYV